MDLIETIFTSFNFTYLFMEVFIFLKIQSADQASLLALSALLDTYICTGGAERLDRTLATIFRGPTIAHSG